MASSSTTTLSAAITGAGNDSGRWSGNQPHRHAFTQGFQPDWAGLLDEPASQNPTADDDQQGGTNEVELSTSTSQKVDVKTNLGSWACKKATELSSRDIEDLTDTELWHGACSLAILAKSAARQQTDQFSLSGLIERSGLLGNSLASYREIEASLDCLSHMWRTIFCVEPPSRDRLVELYESASQQAGDPSQYEGTTMSELGHRNAQRLMDDLTATLLSNSDRSGNQGKSEDEAPQRSQEQRSEEATENNDREQGQELAKPKHWIRPAARV